MWREERVVKRVVSTKCRHRRGAGDVFVIHVFHKRDADRDQPDPTCGDAVDRPERTVRLFYLRVGLPVARRGPTFSHTRLATSFAS